MYRSTTTINKQAVGCLFLLLVAAALYFERYDRPALQDGKLAPAATAAKSSYRAGQLEGLEASHGVKLLDSSLFPGMIEAATQHERKRKMFDLTREPATNGLQKMLNTWMEGSYAPVHKHAHHSESFVALEGALAFFTFARPEEGEEAGGGGWAPRCHVLGPGLRMRGIVVEEGEWHAMTAAPASLGYPGRAIVFETGGHQYDPEVSTKVLAPWAPHHEKGLNGDREYYLDTLFPHCKSFDEERAPGQDE